MSSIAALKFALQQITIYLGLFVLVIGLIGGILNIIIFRTLRTFRETTCAYYLTFASIVGLCQLITALFVRILADGFLINPRKITWFCKIYYFAANWGYIVWLSCICLTTIDQVLSTTKYRYLSNLKFARRFIFVTCLFWTLHGIGLLVYWDSSSGECADNNAQYSVYHSYFTLPILYGCLPILIMIIFSSIAFYKTRTLASRKMNIVRLSRDRQLTAMILVHVIYIIIALIPFTSFYIYTLNIYVTDPLERTSNALTFTITILFEYSMLSAGFYIYCFVSKRFRKQLIYVFGKICLGQWQAWNHDGMNNKIAPKILTITDQLPTKVKIPSVELATVNLNI